MKPDRSRANKSGQIHLLTTSQLVRLHAIMAQQKPAAKPFLHSMEPIAHGCLGDLRYKRLGITQQEQLNRTTSSELFLEHFSSHSECAACYLDDSAVWRCVTTEEQSDANNAVFAS